MGIDVYGSDIESRMIEYTEQNLAWLDTTYSTKYGATHGADSPSIWYDLQVGDATSVKFQNKHVMPLSAVACEGYLGQPFATFPSAERLTEVRSTCNLILKKFLQNIAPQLQPGTSLCLAVPAWQQRTGVFVHLPLVETGSHRQNTPASNGQPAHTRPLDHLEEMGYNRVSFKYVEPKDLIYARADQIVARELLVLIKK
jgi:tRNA G10  N-methylase Trm11